MLNELVTIDTITGWLDEQVANRQIVDPQTWLECAEKINVLLQSEQEKLYQMEQEVAKTKFTLLEEGETNAYAKTFIEGTDAHRLVRTQKARIDRCLEIIRLAKLQSRMASEIMRGN